MNNNSNYTTDLNNSKILKYINNNSKINKDYNYNLNILLNEEYITNFFKTNIVNIINKEVIAKIFINLNSYDVIILSKLIASILIYIAKKFLFNESNTNIFLDQITQNKYQDIKTILFTILPYIDNSNNPTVFNNINNVNDIYNDNITNLQYNRCIRDKDNIYISDIKFDYEHLYDNVILLYDSIDKISNKLFVNWIDVLPLTFNDYRTSKIYLLSNLKEHIISNNLADNINNIGITIQDVYNTYVNDLYLDINNIRWIIYDCLYNKKLTPYYNILSLFLPLEIFFTGKPWVKLDNNEKYNVTNAWSIFINKIENKLGYDNYNIKYDTLSYIIISFVIYFQKYYDNINSLIATNKYIPIELDEGTDDNSDVDDNISLPKIDKYITTIKRVDIENIYDYLSKLLKKLNKTIYGKYLMNVDENNNLIVNRNVIFSNNINNYNQKEIDFEFNKVKYNILNYGFIYYDTLSRFSITLKNIYNYAKSLQHYNKDNNKWTPYAFLWQELILKDKININNRINNTSDANELDWFNINKYVTRFYTSDKKEYYKWFHENINKIHKDLTIQILIKKGILSNFAPNAILTNSQFYNGVEKKIYIKNKYKSTIFTPANIEKYNKTYYYLTDNEFFRLKGFNKTYLDDLCDNLDQDWFTNFSMDWMFQISFFHKFLNNRVSYITGSTGAGKSTQIPKLYHYAFKAFYFVNNAKIICTQPRIAPTEANSERIAIEMGVPLTFKDKKYNFNIPIPENKYIRYNHKTAEILNVNKNNEDTYIYIITDGTLLEELYNNITLKLKNSVKNKYHAILVDEAHEHNANMDIILTLMRESLYKNISIKLGIISATMELDEKIYRRYYRNVNDNLVKPYDMKIVEKYLDKSNVDRRIHVGSIDITTKYQVIEKYLNSKLYGIKNNVDTLLSNLKNIINEVADFAIKLADTTISGDILLFLPGETEIILACKMINTNIKSKNILAVPFYSKMEDSKLKLIKEIHKEIHNIKYPKELAFEYLTNESGFNKLTDNKPDNFKTSSYNRSIIVATNIAEASITIPTLKYVIDTGISKIMKYDVNANTNILKPYPINDTNRIQRRGRVGRTSSGEVFYMYNKNFINLPQSKLYNIVSYDITRKNILSDIYKLINDNVSNSKSLKEYNTYFNIDYDYKGKIGHNDYLISDILTIDNRNTTSLNINYDKIHDFNGNFYIIHPLENHLTRNKCGNIINVENSENDFLSIIQINNTNKIYNIHSNKLEVIINQLVGYKLLILDDNLFFKTEYSKHFMNIYSKLANVLSYVDINICKLIIYGYIYDVLDEVIKLICIMTTINYNPKNLLPNPKDNKIKNINIELFEIYKNNNGDFYALLKILTDLEPLFKYINNHISTNNIHTEIENNYNSFINNNNIVDKKTYIYFYNLQNNFLNNDFDDNQKYQLYYNDNYINIFLKLLTNDFNNNIMIYQDIFKNISQNINFNLIINLYYKSYIKSKHYIYNLINDKNNLVDYINTDISNKITTNSFLWFKNNIRTINAQNTLDKVLKTFIYAYPYNINFNTNNYFNKYIYTNLNSKIIYTMDILYNNRKKDLIEYNTFLSTYNNCIFYLNVAQLKSDTNNLNLSNIDLEDIIIKESDSQLYMYVINVIDYKYFIQIHPHIYNNSTNSKHIDTIYSGYYNNSLFDILDLNIDVDKNLKKYIIKLKSQ